MSDDGQRVRVFVLRSDADAAQLYAFLRQRGELLEKRGKFFQVVVSEYAPTRRNAQNRKMWKVYCTPTAEQVARPRLDPVSWHRLFKTMFLPEICAAGIHKFRYLDNGERELTMSTGHLNEEEFDDYLKEIEAYVVTELGVYLPADPRNLPAELLQP